MTHSFSPHRSLSVAFDAGPLYGPRTGVGVAAHHMLAGLGAHEAVKPLPYLISGRSTPLAGHRRLPVPGIAASHLWSRGDRPRADRWLGEADLVHGTNYSAPPTDLPTLISVYDCWFLAHPELANPLVRRTGLQLRRAVARGAHIHTSSEATAVLARELLDTDRVSTILLGPPEHVGSSDDGEQPEDPVTSDPVPTLDGRRFILAIGTEEYRKAYPRLVEAFGAAVGKGLDVELVIAGGRGDDSARIDDAISGLPESVRSRVARLGRVSAGTKRWLLDHAALLAYPSLDEGFGFPILEAQQVSVPLLATRVGSIPEVAGDGALLVESDVEAIAVGLIALADDEDLQRRLRLAGRLNLTRFSWGATTDQLVGLYRELL